MMKKLEDLRELKESLRKKYVADTQRLKAATVDGPAANDRKDRKDLGDRRVAVYDILWSEIEGLQTLYDDFPFMGSNSRRYKGDAYTVLV